MSKCTDLETLLADFHIDDVSFRGFAKDILITLTKPMSTTDPLDSRRLEETLCLEDVFHFSLNKDGEEEAGFFIADASIKEIEDGTELLKQLGGFRYADPIGKVMYCKIEGDATIQIVSRTCQLA